MAPSISTALDASVLQSVARITCVFTGSGIILDPSPLTSPAALSSRLLDDRGWVAPDLDHDRVYFTDAQYVMTFQFSTRTLLGTYLVRQAATDVNSFFLWHDKLVIGRSSELDIVPVALIGQ
jgi:hypothetical protein